MKILLGALILCFIFEGSLFALAPETVKKAGFEISRLPASAIRIYGAAAIIVALILALILNLSGYS